MPKPLIATANSNYRQRSQPIRYNELFEPDLEQQPDVLYALQGTPTDPVCQLSWVGAE